MVDENELAGKLSPQQVFEHINVGRDLIEKTLEVVGRDGTWEEFHQAIGLGLSPWGQSLGAKTTVVNTRYGEGQG
jgi:hypothetical protein